MTTPSDQHRNLRHYPKIDGLVRRTASDLPEGATDAQAAGRAVLLRQQAVGPASPRLVSSAHGRLDRLLLTIPAYAVRSVGQTSNPLAEAYEDLITKLPADVTYTVVTHRAVEADVRDWFLDRGRTVQITALPDHLHFSVWAEDGYVVVEENGSGRSYFVEPFEFPRYADGLIADAVSNDSDLSHTQAPLYFQGGNVLVGDDFFFIGADYPANSLRYLNRVIIHDPEEAAVDAIHRLYREYLDQTRRLLYIGSRIPVPAQQVRDVLIDGERWTELIYVGNRPGTVQPLFHIDMFLSLAGRDAEGRYQVLVGDPRLAADLLGVPPWAHAMQEVFDGIARDLEGVGFRVHRNPLPLVYVDDPASRQRVWYFATANNALVQIAGDDRRVWLPTYGYGGWTALQATDRANAEVWESLGFAVSMLTDFHPFAENLGAVHCIKKYLKRG
jgi:hypothetical protein